MKKPAGRFTRIALMRTHYHLVLETPNANLVAGIAWLQSTYTIRLNHRHKLIGHVLSGRYKAQLVEGSGNGYLLELFCHRIFPQIGIVRILGVWAGWCRTPPGFFLSLFPWI